LGGLTTAANATFINNGGAFTGTFGGATLLFGTGANAVFTNSSASASGAFGGLTSISGTAGSATITNNGASIAGAGGGRTFFTVSRGISGNADNAVITNNGGTVSGAQGGYTQFSFTSTAGNSTLIANGGTNGGEGGAIFFEDHSRGGTSRVEVFGNGRLDISAHSPRLTIGSVEGDGDVFLGANNLSIGSNDLSTTFSGQIGGTGGSLTKIGSGTLILSGANTYTGDTNVNRGVLQVDGSINSNTIVHGGTLAGTGTINGNVTNNGKVSSGGTGAPGMLTVVGNYTQAQYATLMIQIAGMSSDQFSVLNVLGNANLDGFLDPVLLNGFVPTIGDSFTFLNYASFTGGFSQILNQVFNHGTEQWSVTYLNTNAILTVEAHTPGVPDQGSTFLLLTLGLLGLVTFRQQLVRKQS
jgi:autotransporter-associated beta strand protein